MAARMLEWLVARRRSGLPAYSYLAVTRTDLHLLEIRQGTVPSVRQHLGTWALSQLRGRRLGPYAAAIALGDRDVELEAVEPSSQTARLVDVLVSAPEATRPPV